MIKIFLIFFVLLSNGLESTCQVLTQSKSFDKNVYRVYSWNYSDRYHSSSIDLILFTDNTFKYYEFFPLNHADSSNGTYVIKKDKLILNSHLQEGSIPVHITYVDTPLTNIGISKLFFPTNKKGERIQSVYYYINYDTSFNGLYDPLLMANKPAPPIIYSIKLKCYHNSFSTAWIKISDTSRFIRVELDTDLNFDDYKEKHFKNKVLTLKGDKLFGISLTMLRTTSVLRNRGLTEGTSATEHYSASVTGRQ